MTKEEITETAFKLAAMPERLNEKIDSIEKDTVSMVKMILYNYKQYDNPKRGLFNVDSGKYINGSWSEEKEINIIGEDDNCFIYELKNIDGYYNVDLFDFLHKVNKKCLLPLGIHKSRLIKWIQ